jgi:hypothetical protein
MAWPDRFGIGIFILLLIFFAWLLSSEPQVRLEQALGMGLVVPAVLAILAWIILRTVDFMFGGPQRRRARQRRDAHG